MCPKGRNHSFHACNEKENADEDILSDFGERVCGSTPQLGE
jgi:hypothetical protein